MFKFVVFLFAFPRKIFELLESIDRQIRNLRYRLEEQRDGLVSDLRLLQEQIQSDASDHVTVSFSLGYHRDGRALTIKAGKSASVCFRWSKVFSENVERDDGIIRIESGDAFISSVIVGNRVILSASHDVEEQTGVRTLAVWPYDLKPGTVIDVRVSRQWATCQAKN